MLQACQGRNNLFNTRFFWQIIFGVALAIYTTKALANGTISKVSGDRALIKWEGKAPKVGETLLLDDALETCELKVDKSKGKTILVGKKNCPMELNVGDSVSLSKEPRKAKKKAIDEQETAAPVDLLYFPEPMHLYGSLIFNYTSASLTTVLTNLNITTANETRTDAFINYDVGFGVTDRIAGGIKGEYDLGYNIQDTPPNGTSTTTTSSGLVDPEFYAQGEILHQKDAGVSVDALLGYSLSILPAKTASTSVNGTMGRGGNLTEIEVSAATRFSGIGVKGIFDYEMMGDRTTSDAASGVKTISSGGNLWLAELAGQYFFDASAAAKLFGGRQQWDLISSKNQQTGLVNQYAATGEWRFGGELEYKPFDMNIWLVGGGEYDLYDNQAQTLSNLVYSYQSWTQWGLWLGVSAQF